MNNTLKLFAAALAVGTGALGMAATVVSADNGSVANDSGERAEDVAEGPDVAIVGEALERASAAALEYTALEYGGEGRVTATEIEDEESYYEVEVRLENGNEVDVQLDELFNVVGTD